MESTSRIFFQNALKECQKKNWAASQGEYLKRKQAKSDTGQLPKQQISYETAGLTSDSGLRFPTVRGRKKESHWEEQSEERSSVVQLLLVEARRKFY